jgi:hypothetical protein
MSDTALRWFRSYMTGGRQKCQWNGVFSSWLEVRYGVRQGSLLGPLLFILVICGAPRWLTDMIAKYADDIFCWCYGATHEEVALQLHQRARSFARFTQALGLKMNKQKTQLLYLGKGTGPL